MDRIYKIQYAGLNLPGGSFQYQAPQVKLLPIPQDPDCLEEIASLTEAIIASDDNETIENLIVKIDVILTDYWNVSLDQLHEIKSK